MLVPSRRTSEISTVSRHESLWRLWTRSYRSLPASMFPRAPSLRSTATRGSSPSREAPRSWVCLGCREEREQILHGTRKQLVVDPIRIDIGSHGAVPHPVPIAAVEGVDHQR